MGGPRAREALELGLEVRFATTPFHLQNAPSDVTAQRMQYKVITGGAVGRVHLKGPVYAALDVGLTLAHELKFDGSPTSRTVDLEGGPYFGGGIIIDTDL